MLQPDTLPKHVAFAGRSHSASKIIYFYLVLYICVNIILNLQFYTKYVFDCYFFKHYCHRLVVPDLLRICKYSPIMHNIMFIPTMLRFKGNNTKGSQINRKIRNI